MSIGVEVRDGGARLVLDAPPLNILTRDLLAELRSRLAELERDRALRVVILAAAGKHFSAGASVEEHLPGEVERMLPEFLDTVRTIESFPVPVIAAVQGRCLGGGLELVLAADIVLAAEGALLGVPEIRLGVLPPAACVLLPRLVPPGAAAEMVFGGGVVDAAAAEAIGLVRRTVPVEELQREADDLAASIARNSAAALREAKKALRAGRGDPSDAWGEVSRVYLEDLMRTSDAAEGLAAFVEKRTPEWSHA